jgi:hypothetical protein
LLLLATLALNLAIVVAVLIRLPSDYCCATDGEPRPRPRRGVLERTGAALKNLIGAVLIAVGAVLSLPGVPGQGLLTVLAGILLLDFPGRRRLVCKLLARPLLRRQVNALRARFSKPPLAGTEHATPQD